MKFHETHFEEYISGVNKNNLHPKMDKIYKNFPLNIQDLKNIIFYGPGGTGKYSQVLYSIKKYSSMELKYERKISINLQKTQYIIKVSDIHYEVDMSLMGCNAKLLWHEIYQQITDIVSTKLNKTGILICKNFHDIPNELLETFYNYMQKNNLLNIDIKFILITQEISFIPNNIINNCELIRIPRPSKSHYLKCMNMKSITKINVENITNMKNICTYNENLMNNHKIICDKIICELMNTNNFKLLNFRDIIYDIFIYNLNIPQCVWYILIELINKKLIARETLTVILLKTYNFLQYYNNNYRPIFHLENYLLTIYVNIHKKDV